MKSLNWKTPGQQRLGLAMATLFAAHHDLLLFIFDPEEPRLSMTPDLMLQRIKGFSSGERLLIRLALDIWNDSGEVKITELLNTLDPTNFTNAIAALCQIGPKPLNTKTIYQTLKQEEQS